MAIDDLFIIAHSSKSLTDWTVKVRLCDQRKRSKTPFWPENRLSPVFLDEVAVLLDAANPSTCSTLVPALSEMRKGTISDETSSKFVAMQCNDRFLIEAVSSSPSGM